MFEEIIKNGSMEEIEIFTLENFHKIKHTDSYKLLLARMKGMEDSIKKAKQLKVKIAESLTNARTLYQQDKKPLEILEQLVKEIQHHTAIY